jgi:hypothetical protein
MLHAYLFPLRLSSYFLLFQHISRKLFRHAPLLSADDHEQPVHESRLYHGFPEKYALLLICDA